MEPYKGNLIAFCSVETLQFLDSSIIYQRIISMCQLLQKFKYQFSRKGITSNIFMIFTVVFSFNCMKTAESYVVLRGNTGSSGLPRCLRGEESACQFRSHRRRRFDPWVGKIPRRRCQPTPVFLPGKSPTWRSLVGYSPVTATTT